MEGGGRVFVATQLGVGVAEHAVRGGLVIIRGDRALAPRYGVLELVPGEGQGAQPDQRVGVFGGFCQGLIKDAVGAGVVTRVAGFARSLEICQAKLGGALLIARVLAQALLKLADLAVRS